MPAGKLVLVKRRRGPHAHRAKRITSKNLTGKVKKIIDRYKENKYKDSDIITSTPVLATSVVTLLSGIALGDDEEERDGNVVRVSSVQLIATVTADIDPTSDTIFRFIVFRANTNIGGVLPTVTQIIESDSNESLRQHEDITNDFTIHFDRRVILPVPYITGRKHVRLLEWKKNFKIAKVMTFDLDTAVIGACSVGHWFSLLIVNQAAGSVPTFDYHFRIMFKDA